MGNINELRKIAQEDIDKISKLKFNHKTMVMRNNILKNIKQAGYDEITIAVNKDNVICDVLVNGKPVKCYCVVPKDQLEEYLKKRF